MGSCIIFIENYIFTGDTLFSSSVGRTDLEGGSEELLKKSLDLLKVKLTEIAEDSIVAPGHDMQNNEKLCTVSQILKINPFLKTKNHIL
jgi:glyoxylase-like metal-dependent hydrolase (beta-lactamase superfamily II)